ncbi:unnamed protein product [Amoebophrya sp. A120]|nr:unnamed protein product [Amoebophrya sp. A120]|eukprot:GSA120T00003091001.1
MYFSTAAAMKNVILILLYSVSRSFAVAIPRTPSGLLNHKNVASSCLALENADDKENQNGNVAEPCWRKVLGPFLQKKTDSLVKVAQMQGVEDLFAQPAGTATGRQKEAGRCPLIDLMELQAEFDRAENELPPPRAGLEDREAWAKQVADVVEKEQQLRKTSGMAKWGKSTLRPGDMKNKKSTKKAAPVRENSRTQQGKLKLETLDEFLLAPSPGPKKRGLRAANRLWSSDYNNLDRQRRRQEERYYNRGPIVEIRRKLLARAAQSLVAEMFGTTGTAVQSPEKQEVSMPAGWTNANPVAGVGNKTSPPQLKQDRTHAAGSQNKIRGRRSRSRSPEAHPHAPHTTVQSSKPKRSSTSPRRRSTASARGRGRGRGSSCGSASSSSRSPSKSRAARAGVQQLSCINEENVVITPPASEEVKAAEVGLSGPFESRSSSFSRHVSPASSVLSEEPGAEPGAVVLQDEFQPEEEPLDGTGSPLKQPSLCRHSSSATVSTVVPATESALLTDDELSLSPASPAKRGVSLPISPVSPQRSERSFGSSRSSKTGKEQFGDLAPLEILGSDDESCNEQVEEDKRDVTDVRQQEANALVSRLNEKIVELETYMIPLYCVLSQIFPMEQQQERDQAARMLQGAYKISQFMAERDLTGESDIENTLKPALAEVAKAQKAVDSVWEKHVLTRLNRGEKAKLALTTTGHPIPGDTLPSREGSTECNPGYVTPGSTPPRSAFHATSDNSEGWKAGLELKVDDSDWYQPLSKLDIDEDVMFNRHSLSHESSRSLKRIPNRPHSLKDIHDNQAISSSAG